ncbi:MAG: hypothetical protein HC838_01910 [Spirulinaceae cyanobacterium RM2_2_10]|nr:hypothetical protein [Spirulinaceae cyanobacterium SM2_1_0]NJO19064.1 hypothetical protein [Spirulinaceae cyanobacterium RM2_2_10]
MLNQLQLLPGAVAAILADVAETGVLTLSDRYGLLAASLSDDLDDEERRAVNRILRSVQRGRVQVVAA